MSEFDDLQEFNERITNAAKQLGRTKSLQDCCEAVPTCEGNSKSRILSTNNDQMWAVYGGKNYSACEKAVAQLPPGQYTIEASDMGIYFRSAEVNLDELVDLPDSVSEQVINEVESFWKKEEHFRKFGFLWKRGALLWGAPGGGKTSCLQVISQRIIDQGGISIYVNHPGITAKGLSILRSVEPTRPLVVMIEDIDAVIDNHGEAALLALMDGELQIDRVVFIATTNYPERLDKRFINRPSRFDIVKKIGMPSEAARQVYLMKKNARLANDTKELAKWIAVTRGFSIAHIKELIISVEVFELPLDDAVKRLKTMMDVSPSSEESDGKFGFGS